MVDVTNHFPNPAVVTLADATRPANMGRYFTNAQSLEVTRAAVGGGYAARVETTVPDLGNGMMLAASNGGDALNDFGLGPGSYLLSLDVTAPSTPQNFKANDWLVMESWGPVSDYFFNPNGGYPAPGASRRVHMPFKIDPDDTAMNLSTYSVYTGTGGYVYYGNISIVETVIYVDNLDTYLPNGTVNLSAAGLTGGKSYLLTIGHSKVNAGQFAAASLVAGASSGTATEFRRLDAPSPTGLGWYEEQIVFTVPDGAAYVGLVLTGTLTGNVWWLTVTDAPEPYFDGSTADGGGYSYDWTGAADASPSTRTAAATSSANAQVFVGGTAKAVSEIRVSDGGELIPITEVGT